MAAEAFKGEQNRGQVALAFTQRQCSPFDNSPGKLKLWEREASRVARLQELAAVDSSEIYGNGMNEMARNR